MALEELGKQAEARGHFKQAVQADEKHAHAWQAWGVMESRAGNPALARTPLLTLAPPPNPNPSP